MAATSGEGDATHELWPRVERISLFHLLLIACSWSQTIGVKPIDPVNILSSQAGAITARVRDQATKYAQTVDRGQALQDALDEQALRQSGAMSNPDDNLNLETADQIISGSAGLSATGRWFINLTLINVNTGRVIGSKDATVSSYDELLIIAKMVTKALLQGTELENDEHVTTINDSNPIIIGTEKTIQEVHVYQHPQAKPGHAIFIPCSFCSGTGYLPASTGSGKKDCPYCSITSKYEGPATHGQTMTGRWTE